LNFHVFDSCVSFVNSKKLILEGALGCALLMGNSMALHAGFVDSSTPGSFGNVVHAVDAHRPLIVLSDPENQAMVAVSPSMQGRVLTSTANGWSGRSYGWVNLELIASGKVQEHFNAYGGEDRIWLGPEGGQYSIFFAHGAPFDLAHWYTPAALDTEPFLVVRQSKTEVSFERSFTIENYSGTKFSVKLDREIRLLSQVEILQSLHLSQLEGLKAVAFESINKLTNAGKDPWKKETGLLSLWVLGQFQAAPQTTIVIPVQPGPVAENGEPVNSDYFGEVPSNRIRTVKDVIYFKADADFRSKIGVNPKRATGILGSYDAQNQVLTIAQYSLPHHDAEYVNSEWKIQDHPYMGDTANSYNDGPPSPGAPQLGKFYELESSSPAAALAPGVSIEHRQRTIHLQGSEEELDKVARKILSTSLNEIKDALPE
jgi:hypothetical protein